MDVEKTVSPQMLRGAPKALPAKDSPDFRLRTAGKRVVEACVTNPRKREGIRGIERANMAVVYIYLMIEKRENEVTEITVATLSNCGQ